MIKKSTWHYLYMAVFGYYNSAYTEVEFGDQFQNISQNLLII
jgi:hypothetical protein